MTLPEPFYDADGITIYHGDCRDLLPVTTTADAVITDPPYGTDYYPTDTGVMDAELLQSLFDVAPIVAIFGWPERLCQMVRDADRNPNEWITWWPTNGALRGFNLHGLWRESEHIAVWGEAPRWTELRKSRNTESQRMAIARQHYGDAPRLNGSPHPDGARLGDVWRDPSPGMSFNAHLRKHPNEKPIGVMSRLIDACTNPGEMVIDPFMGSGTTLRAAKDLGRRAIGIEIEENYCKVAVDRLAQGVLPLEAS